MTEKLFLLLNRQNKFILWILYLIFHTFLILVYIAQTDFNINLLLHINQKYYELNSFSRFDSMVVLKDGGYDGQFYYFIARYLYDSEIKTLYLDSVEFRILRLGASLIYGILPSFFGWKYYTYLALFVNFLFFSLSYFFLYEYLNPDKKYLAYFYLFNPFTVVSNMLVLADTLFVSFFIIFLYFMNRANLSFERTDQSININIYFLISLAIGIFLILIKETIIFYYISFLTLFRIQKNKAGYLTFLILLIIFVLWFIYMKEVVLHSDSFISTSATLSHLDRIRIPFESIIKIIWQHIDNFKFQNSIPIFLLILIYIILIVNLKNFFKNVSLKNVQKNYILYNLSLFFPILFIIGIISIIDIEYWFAFDNISRIYLFAFVWIILLKNLNSLKYKDYHFLFISLSFDLLLLARYYYKKVGEFIVL